MSPFYALYGYHPEIHFDLEDKVLKGEAPQARVRVEALKKEREMLEKQWQTATKNQKKHYDRKHMPMSFAVGDKVMLLTKNLRQLRPSKKLSDRYLGPFVVEQVVGTHRQAYKLKLPQIYHIPPVFHVSLLEPFIQGANEELTEQQIIEIEGELHWIVESVLAHRDNTKTKRREYLVKWRDYSPAENTWEPAEHFQDQTWVEEYEKTAHSQQEKKQRGGLKKPRRL